MRCLTLALGLVVVSAVKETISFGSKADGFLASVNAAIDEAPTYGIDAGASLTVGLPQASCTENSARCQEFKETRKTLLAQGVDADSYLADIELVTTFTAKSQQCNLMNMELDFEATLNVKLASTQTCSDCVGTCTNIVQCVYDSNKKLFEDYCYKFNGEKGVVSGLTGNSCNTFQIPAVKTTKNIDFSQSAYALSLRLSDLVSAASGGAGELMQALGTDVTWSITPGSIITAFTGFQFQIQMETTVLDTGKIAGISAVPGTLINPLWQGIGMKKGTDGNYAVYDDVENFLKLIEKAVPSAKLPAFLSKTPGAITVGDVSKACEKTPVDYSITVTGADKSALTPEAVGKALSTAMNAKLKAAGDKLSLPTCETKNDVISFPTAWPPTTATAKSTASLICLLSSAADTQLTENADGSVTVKGKVNPGAGSNPVALQAAMASAVSDGSVKVGSGTVGKTVGGYTKCTDAQCKAAGQNTVAACGPGVCAPNPTPSPGGGGGGGGGSSCGAGCAAGATVGTLAGVGLIGAGIHMHRKRQEATLSDPLVDDGGSYTRA